MWVGIHRVHTIVGGWQLRISCSFSGALAHLVERVTVYHEVAGSSPVRIARGYHTPSSMVVCFPRTVEAGQPWPNWLQENSTLGLAAKGGVILVDYNEKVICRVVPQFAEVTEPESKSRVSERKT